MSNIPWYKEGLKFKCTECGKCCTGASGLISLSLDEATKMADLLGCSFDLFKRKYLKTRGNKLSLVEKKNKEGGFDCVFLNGKKCAIYEARPTQCRTFPWWPENLNSEESWKIAAKDCEGISDSAPLIPYSQIVQLLKK